LAEPAGPPGKLFVVAGPSGVGKGSVVARARQLLPQLWVSVSWATRAPRPGEVDGEHYHFVTEQQFRAEAERGGFLEYAHYAGHFKGTPRRAVRERRAAGYPVLLEIDVQGARQVRDTVPEAVQVFLQPPDLAELERRLASRGTEDPAQVRDRLRIALDELAAADEFDEVIVNHTVEESAQRLVALIRSRSALPDAQP
jgi:guanylate kinase